MLIPTAVAAAPIIGMLAVMGILYTALICWVQKDIKKLIMDTKKEQKGEKLPEVRQGKDVSIGFMVEAGQQPNSVVVFNFTSKHKERPQ